MNKKIIVTGGAGFIGVNLVLRLKDLGYKHIFVVDHVSSKNKKNLPLLGKIKYFDKDEFRKLIKKSELENVSLIVHLGARSDTTETNEKFMMDNNVSYSKLLFEYCVFHKTPFIYASSAATYGDGSRGYDDSERNLKPLNLYGKTSLLLRRLDDNQKKYA